MSLHIKHRPKDLISVLGNKSTINALQAIINKENPPHAFLFVGQSGCGKTTLARILVKELGCSDMDIVELNAANFRGIDTAREIIQQMRLTPISGKTRAWIIDESHQLTKDGQSALLKALEDTPKHVYFVLATTDPQKLLPTIKNRCTTFTVQPLSEEKIQLLLKDILNLENKKIPEEALEKISHDCFGSPRMAIVMLDKIIDLPERKMIKAINEASEINHTTIELCRSLVKCSKWIVVAKILTSLQDQEPEQIRLAILGYCKTVLLKEENDRVFLIMESFKEPFFNSGFAGLVRACYEALIK